MRLAQRVPQSRAVASFAKAAVLVAITVALTGADGRPNPAPKAVTVQIIDAVCITNTPTLEPCS
jgi:hypothetical protein